jgi:hypothetical protein
MGFTGADNDSLEQIEEELSCETLPLSVTFRCPKLVVEQAQKFVPDITANETNIDGVVSRVAFSAFTPKVGDAILCRLNKYLVRMFFELLRKGIPAKIEGRDQIKNLINLVKRFKTKDIYLAYESLSEWSSTRINELNEKRRFTAAEDLQDKVECVMSVMEHVMANDGQTVKDLEVQLESMFGDEVDSKNVVVLCSVHKSKGLEWPNVYILGFDQFMPSKYAKKDWEQQQEANLQYVAVTRAMQLLTFVTDIPAKIERSSGV